MTFFTDWAGYVYYVASHPLVQTALLILACVCFVQAGKKAAQIEKEQAEATRNHRAMLMKEFVEEVAANNETVSNAFCALALYQAVPKIETQIHAFDRIFSKVASAVQKLTKEGADYDIQRAEMFPFFGMEGGPYIPFGIKVKSSGSPDANRSEREQEIVALIRDKFRSEADANQFAKTWVGFEDRSNFLKSVAHSLKQKKDAFESDGLFSTHEISISINLDNPGRGREGNSELLALLKPPVTAPAGLAS